MRITTNMIMRNYQNNLTDTLGGLETARRQVETGRRYAYAYESPSAAAKGAVLDRRYARNKDYLDTVQNVQKWQDSQEGIVKELNSIVVQIDKDYSVGAMSDPSGTSGRSAYAKTLRELQLSMVETLNSKYSDAYIMSGSSADEAPFSLSEDRKKLLYHGVDVNDPANADALKKLSEDTSYVDLGFGLNFGGDGKIVSSSAFDTALPGINVVGYGQTDEGVSKNLVVLVGQMAEELEKDEFDRDAYGKLWTQFDEGTQSLQDAMTRIGAKSQLLETTKERLEMENDDIEDQYQSTMGIDPAESITKFSWAQYVYNAALKIGTSIINPSLLDFMS